MIFNTYKIHHFDLSADNMHVNLGGGAHYCVFWYRSVPLGERYFRAPVSEDLFWCECLDAIWPALLHHYDLTGISPAPEKPSKADAASLKALCDDAVANHHPLNIPARCDVSIVICTRNRAALLRKCLKHLQLQQCRPAEIIVVDNAPSNNDTENVVREFEGIRYVREERRGLDIARNRGAQEAGSSVVAYLDDDTVPDIYWTYRIFETFRDPSLAAMTGLVLAASLSTEAEVIFEKYWPFNRGYISKQYDHHFFSATLDAGPPVWEIGAGANMAFRKAIFEEVGYFDERLDAGAAGCNGDSELWYRILANGFTIRYNPKAVVQHHHRNSIQDLKRQLYAYMRGFTVAILIQHQRFGHRGNLLHLLTVVPRYYLTLIRKGFPYYKFQYRTLLSEMRGIVSGLFYYWRHRNTNSNIYG